jgi:hypothetical protein
MTTGVCDQAKRVLRSVRATVDLDHPEMGTVHNDLNRVLRHLDPDWQPSDAVRAR